MDSLVSFNLLTIQLSIVCTASAPGAGELRGSVVLLVICSDEGACGFKAPQRDMGVLRAREGWGSTGAKQGDKIWYLRRAQHLKFCLPVKLAGSV